MFQNVARHKRILNTTAASAELSAESSPNAKPRESLEEPLDLATCSTCALQGFSRQNIVVGQPLLPIFHN